MFNFCLDLWKKLELDKMTEEQKQQLEKFLDSEFKKIEKKVKKGIDKNK